MNKKIMNKKLRGEFKKALKENAPKTHESEVRLHLTGATYTNLEEVKNKFYNKNKIMNKEIKTTRKSIIKAFRKWNKEYLENPEQFEEIDKTKGCAEMQADYLIERL